MPFANGTLNSIWTFGCAIVLAQALFGLGVAAQLTYMLRFASNSQFPATSYAIIASVMILGFIVPGIIAGWIQQRIGYSHFFIWASLCGIPALIITFTRPIRQISQ